MSVNKVILLGRLGQDPELKYTPSGTAVCNFTVATSESYKDKSGNRQEKTEWSRIVVWGKLAELCNQYLSKGRQVYVEGRLQTRMWEKDNHKNYITEINATTVQFIGSSPQSNSNEMSKEKKDAIDQGSAMNQSYNVSTDINFTEQDIPF